MCFHLQVVVLDCAAAFYSNHCHDASGVPNASLPPVCCCEGTIHSCAVSSSSIILQAYICEGGDFASAQHPPRISQPLC
ncbi:MAG: hypothetical protein ACK56I_16345 [bacterium]